MDPRQGHERRQLLQEFQRRQFDADRAIRPQLCERVDEVSTGIFLATLKCHGASRRVSNQAFQLVASMGWDLGVGVERKLVDAGTAGARVCGVFPCIAKPRPDAPHLLPGPLPKGDALLDGGGHGTGELGLSAAPPLPACGGLLPVTRHQEPVMPVGTTSSGRRPVALPAA